MKKIRVITVSLLFIITFLTIPVTAQNAPESPDNKDISFDAERLFNGFSGAGFLLRINNPQSALRVKFNGIINTRENETAPSIIAETKDLSFFPGVGIEWGNDLDKFRFYYGSDLLLGIGKTESPTEEENFFSIGAGPLTGIRTNFGERFTAALEAHAYLGYRSAKHVDSDLSNTEFTLDFFDGVRLWVGYQF
ncbi:MAG: hypothetical protein ACLFUC_07425 [Bacteroidales bacterium]